MNKWLMLVVLVLFAMASAVGLRNLQANQTAVPSMASTGNPVPIMPPPDRPKGGLYASTGNPVPIMPPPQKSGSGSSALFASTGNPVPIMPPPQKSGSSGL